MQAVLALSARFVHEAEADAVAFLEGCDFVAEVFDDADALVAEDAAGVEEVLVSAADAGVGDADEDVVVVEGAGGGGLGDLAGLGAAEDFEGDFFGRHW